MQTNKVDFISILDNKNALIKLLEGYIIIDKNDTLYKHNDKNSLIKKCTEICKCKNTFTNESEFLEPNQISIELFLKIKNNEFKIYISKKQELINSFILTLEKICEVELFADFQHGIRQNFFLKITTLEFIIKCLVDYINDAQISKYSSEVIKKLKSKYNKC